MSTKQPAGGREAKIAGKRKAKFRLGQVVFDKSDGTYCRIIKVLKDGTVWGRMEREGTSWTFLQKHLRPLTRRERGV
jgi:hypothetical protein